MRERSFVGTFCAALLILWANTNASAFEISSTDKRITLLAEEIPGGFLKIDGIRGVGVYPELFYEAAAASNTEIVFRFVPWGRAFREVERSTHFMTFPLTRLPERETRYRWLVSLDRDEIVFLSLDKPINTLDQGRKLGRVLVWEGSSMEIFLRQKEFSNLLPVGKTRSLVRMLIHGRANAWFTVRPEKMEAVSKEGRPVKIISGDVIHTESIWLAGGKSFTHSEESRRFTEMVRKLVENDRLTELKAKLGLSQK